jgi:sugar phosphate isomerase/epimerase
MQARRMPVGSQLYGWGQYYGREKKSLSASLDEVFAALRDAGYDFAEGSLDVARPENNAAFADKLKARGLRPVSLYSGGRLHEAGKADEVVGRMIEAAKVCKQAGFLIINCNPDPIGREKTDEELSTQAASLEKLGKALLAMRMLLGVHNHTPEMANNAREFHHNFRKTDNRLVGFCFDTHWVFRGGLPPMNALHEYHERVVSWHLRQSRDKVWWEDLDEGDIDYKEIAGFTSDHDMLAPYIVELALERDTKITRTVVENHKRSREFVRKVFGV